MQSRIIKYLIYNFLLAIMIMTRYKHVFIIAFINMCNSFVIVWGSGGAEIWPF